MGFNRVWCLYHDVKPVAVECLRQDVPKAELVMPTFCEQPILLWPYKVVDDFLMQIFQNTIYKQFQLFGI